MHRLRLVDSSDPHVELSLRRVGESFALEYGVTGARLGQPFALSRDSALSLARFINGELFRESPDSSNWKEL